jgi:hypothetical protein
VQQRGNAIHARTSPSGHLPNSLTTLSNTESS